MKKTTHRAHDFLMTRWQGLAFTALAASLSVVASTPLVAQALPQPVIHNVFPPAAQIGTETEVSIAGVELGDAPQLRFSTEGITANPKAGKFVVKIPAETEQGLSDLRVTNRIGVSNPRRFFIGQLPVTVVPAGATSQASVFKVKLEGVYAGKAVKNATTFLAFDAEKGQRLFIVCRPALLDSRMEVAASVVDASGRVLERLRPDGVLDFTPAQNGTFTLKLHDLMFRGGDDYAYCAIITSKPLVETVFTDGKTATVYGRNLPSGTPVEALQRYGKPLQRLVLPGEQANALIAGSVIEPARFGAVTDGAEDNSSPANSPTAPLRFAGWFPPNGKPRVFTFEAIKGDSYAIEVTSSRLGAPADPFFVLEKVTVGQDGQETYNTVAEVYDAPPLTTLEELTGIYRDPVHRFDVRDDGKYRVILQDLFCNSSSAPRQPYELTIEKTTASFRLVTVPVALPKAKAARNVDFGFNSLWRGGSLAMKVIAFRKPGFTSPIELSVENLPAGVTAECGVIPQNGTSGYILFKADDKVTQWAGAVGVRGTAIQDGQEVKEGASQSAALTWKVTDSTKEPVFTRLSKDLFLAVNSDADAPIAISPAATGKIEIVAGAKYTLPVNVTRRDNATDAVKVRLLGVGTAATIPETEVAAKATEGKLTMDTAALKVPVGEHQVLLQGTLKIKYSPAAEDLRIAEEELKKLTGELATLAAAAKTAADLVAKASPEQTGDAKAAAEQSKAKHQEAEARKNAAEKRTKALKAKSPPKDVVFVQYSQPMTLVVKEAPKK